MSGIRYATKFPVWKQDGHEGDYPKDPMEALALAQGNYITVKQPLFWKDESGFDISTGKFGLIRGRTKTDSTLPLIGIVSANYEPIQHSTFAAACRPVADKFPLQMVTLAGTHREHLYLAFDLGQYPVGGLDSEMIQQYLYGGNCNDGGTGISLSVKTERLKCQNQLPTFFRNSTFSVRIRHSVDALLTTQQWVKYLGQVQRMAKEQQQQFDRLFVTKIVKEQMVELIAAAYPLPKSKMVEQYVDEENTELNQHLPMSVHNRRAQLEQDKDRVYRLREAAQLAVERMSDQSPALRGTAYGAFNGVTYCESWRVGKGAGESVLFGDRAKTCERAFQAALSFAN